MPRTASAPLSRPLPDAAPATTDTVPHRRQQGGPHAGPHADGLWLALHLVEPDLQQAAATLYQFSPRVCLQAPDMLLAEISGSLQLFGGLASLRQQVAAAFAEQDLQIGIAPTPLAARLLALNNDPRPLRRAGDLASRLEPLPLALLVADLPKLYPRLARLGLRQLGELLRLPRAGLRKRFGRPLVEWIERLLGQRPEPHAPWRPPRRYQADRDLDDPLSGSGELLPAITLMLEAFCRWLRYHELRAEGLTLRFFHHHRPASALTLRLLRPGGDASRMATLLALHLERLQLPAPVTALRLEGIGLVEKRADSAGWWHPEGDAEDWWMTLESIRARLGDDCVRLLQCVDTHHPELAWRQSGYQQDSAQPTDNPRPLWLLPRARLLGARDIQNMTLLSRPERIAGGWWDVKPLRRDYFVARIGTQKLWVFKSVEGWYEHGFF